MIRATVETREGGLTRRVGVIAPSVERALRIAGYGKPGRRVRVAYPAEPGAFFVRGPVGGRDAELLGEVT